MSESALVPGEIHSYLNGLFQIVLVENHGAFLGLGHSLPDSVKQALLVGIIGLGLVAGMFWLAKKDNLSVFAYIAGVLFISGGIGNLIDRAYNHGGVVDFMYMGIGQLHTGIFNVADIFIMIAAFIMFALSFKTKKQANSDSH